MRGSWETGEEVWCIRWRRASGELVDGGVVKEKNRRGEHNTTKPSNS
jgi:hypothetical protein